MINWPEIKTLLIYIIYIYTYITINYHYINISLPSNIYYEVNSQKIILGQVIMNIIIIDKQMKCVEVVSRIFISVL